MYNKTKYVDLVIHIRRRSTFYESVLQYAKGFLKYELLSPSNLSRIQNFTMLQ